MTIYNLWIFDERGTLLFYREWLRKNHTSMEKDEVSFSDVPYQLSYFNFVIIDNREIIKEVKYFPSFSNTKGCGSAHR